jgi:hypothetical protein
MAEEKLIWDTLMRVIGNPYGVAGLMGNLFAESSLNPKCMTGKNKKKYSSSDDYISKVDNKIVSCDEFIHDGIAFGIVQWCYWGRKENLYLWAEKYGPNIGDLNMQLAFMLDELPKYKTVWNIITTTKSIREASDIVMLRYEQPSDTSDKAKEKRAAFGQGYYDKFALQEVPTPMKRWVETTAANVKLRAGNGKNFSQSGMAITKGSRYEWVATANNGWHAILAKSGKQVLWISGDFTKIVEE